MINYTRRERRLAAKSLGLLDKGDTGKWLSRLKRSQAAGQQIHHQHLAAQETELRNKEAENTVVLDIQNPSGEDLPFTGEVAEGRIVAFESLQEDDGRAKVTLADFGIKEDEPMDARDDPDGQKQRQADKAEVEELAKKMKQDRG